MHNRRHQEDHLQKIQTLLWSVEQPFFDTLYVKHKEYYQSVFPRSSVLEDLKTWTEL